MSCGSGQDGQPILGAVLLQELGSSLCQCTDMNYVIYITLLHPSLLTNWCFSVNWKKNEIKLSLKTEKLKQGTGLALLCHPCMGLSPNQGPFV